MSSHKILLVDDEKSFLDTLSPFLQRNGFIVKTAQDGQEALDRIAEFEPDLVVLDVLLPRIDGREVCRRLRSINNWIPIIMLTQVEGAAERTLSLIEGADDYINKPFDPAELVARIQALLRRVKLGETNLMSSIQLVAGPLRIDRHSYRVWLDEKELFVKPKTFAVLAYMMSHPDQVLTRERLLDAVWGWDFPVGTRTVDVRIAELRKHLNDDPSDPRFIETIVGVGYRFIHKVEG